MPRIRIKNGPTQGQTYNITGETLVIGRDATANIVLQDKGVSRRHAEIFSVGEMCFIRDLDSRNGSFLNDNRVTEELLRDGDKLQIGGTVMLFEALGGITANDLEFSEDELTGFYELRLEDITSANVGENDLSASKYLRALYRLSRLSASESSEKNLINKVLPFVTDTLHAGGSYLFSKNPQTGEINSIGIHISKDKKPGRLSKTIIRKVLQDRKALLVTDAMQDDRFSSRESVMKHNIHAVICVPLSLSVDLPGVLYIASDELGISFNEEELELSVAMAEQIGLAISHLRSQEKQREYMLSIVQTFMRVIDYYDPNSSGHNERVSGYATAIGKSLCLNPIDLENLQLAVLMHNCGKLLISAQTTDDPAIEQRIVSATIDMLSKEMFYPEIEEVIKFQLERYDGSGPLGLKGGQIPLGVRIFQVAHDLEDIITSLDPGPIDKLLEEAVKTIDLSAGKVYDTEIVNAMLRAYKDGSLGLSMPEQWKKNNELDCSIDCLNVE